MGTYVVGVLILVLAGGIAAAPAAQEPAASLALARRWIDAVRKHQPGTVDSPLLELADWGDSQFAAVRQELSTALERAARWPNDRNEVLRRAILLHTDIAMLEPARAAKFAYFVEPPPRGIVWTSRAPRPESAAGTMVYGTDGQYTGLSGMTAHWRYARSLASEIRPDPSKDSFVVGWYRAMAAHFEIRYDLGLAAPHLERARGVLPHDAWILFYSGALHEALAAPRYQNIERSRPSATGRGHTIDSPRRELERTAGFYRESTTADPSLAEAHIRLGRVLGLLGRHPEALERLRRGMTFASDPMLRYYGELFAAAEYESLGRREESRRAYERCVALFPTAQAPLVGLSELARRAGSRQAALDALGRLAALPADAGDRTDPWWVYLRQQGWNAPKLLQDLRRPFLHGGAP